MHLRLGRLCVFHQPELCSSPVGKVALKLLPPKKVKTPIFESIKLIPDNFVTEKSSCLFKEKYHHSKPHNLEFLASNKKLPSRKRAGLYDWTSRKKKSIKTGYIWQKWWKLPGKMPYPLSINLINRFKDIKNIWWEK